MLSALSSSQQPVYNTASCSYSRPPSILSGGQHVSQHSAPMHGKSPNLSATYPGAGGGVLRTREGIVSPRQMFRVFSYTPAEGAAGASIVVNVHFKLVSAETTFLRIVVGTRALSTTVRQAQDRRFGEWELEAVIPELETASPGTAAPSATVPLTVQALNGTNETLDSVMFGNFTYSNRRIPPSPVLLNRADRGEEYGYGQGTPGADVKPTAPVPVPTRKSSRPTAGSGTARARALNAAMSSKDAQSARGQLKKQSLIRARRSGSDEDDAESAYRAVLQIETPLDGMADVREWDGEEKRVGRRLVRFSRVQEGCTLRVRCEALKPAEYTDGDTVVSCIYRPADGTGTGTEDGGSRCCITSVDIIFLLECLVGDIFNIEEKNRIRRNLEGYRPKTVSKNKPGTEDFFQKIMDFPAPKPRNIEKDVKVFDWAVLPQALNKIISKYTLYPPSNKQDLDGSSSDPSTTPVSMSPDPAHSASIPPYSAHSSPRTEHTSPPPPPADHSYFSFHPPYHRPPYVSDPLDSSYVPSHPLSSTGGYDVLLPPHSATTTPSPLISTPADSPNVPTSGPMSMQYSPPSEHYNEPSHVLYPSPLIDHDAYGSVYSSMSAGSSYDTVDYHHNVKSDLHDSSSYM